MTITTRYTNYVSHEVEEHVPNDHNDYQDHVEDKRTLLEKLREFNKQYYSDDLMDYYDMVDIKEEE